MKKKGNYIPVDNKKAKAGVRFAYMFGMCKDGGLTDNLADDTTNRFVKLFIFVKPIANLVNGICF